MKKRVSITLVSIAITITVALLVLGVNSYSNKSYTTYEISTEDNKKCLGGEGYVYDSEINACIKIWELDEEKKEAAKIAVSEIKDSISTTNVINVDSDECPGCFNVLLESENRDLNISLVNWEVIKKEQKIEDIMTEEICLDNGGRVASNNEEECEDDEMKIGNIISFINPSICCSQKP